MAGSAPFLMPKLGLTMTEGQVVEWRVQAGQAFTAGQTVVVVETEKIANEISAPADGAIRSILIEEGETVPVGTPIAEWVLDGEAAEVASAPVAEVATPTPAPSRAEGARVRATPVAKRLAAEHGVDLNAITGSGPGGRIKAEDVEAVIANQAEVPTPTSIEAIEVERLTPTAYQRSAARRLGAQKEGVPHFYLATEAEAAEILRFEAQLNEIEGRPRVGLTHLIVAAVARAVADLPTVNRVWEGDQIVQFSEVDVGLAVDTEAGLMVPVLRDLAAADLHVLAVQAGLLVARTREGRLGPDDVGGGAVTVSNAGMHDITYMTSIITPGQSSILGVGSIREVFRPDARRRPRLHREMGLVLSCDHRILDGVAGAAFLNRIKAYIESPLNLLLATPGTGGD